MAGLRDMLLTSIRQYPERIALRDACGDLSYEAMWQAASGLAGQLKMLGVRRAGLCGDNSMAWVLADLASLLADVVCVPVPAFFSPSQFQHLQQTAALDCLLFSAEEQDSVPLGNGVWLRKLNPAPGYSLVPEQTAKITFTSGSTGTPKGVCLSARQMAATTRAMQERMAGVTLRTHLCILPLATLLENIAGVYLPLTMGATVDIAPLASLGMTGSSGLDLDRLVAGINQHHPDSLILVPELAMGLVAAAERGRLDKSSFRFLAVGGGRVSADLLARGRAAGLPLYEGYGLSECGSVVALNVPGEECEGTVGKPLPHLEVRVDGAGRILVRGNTHLGYLGYEPEASDWLDTGDLGALSPDGYLTVDGRAKNLLITSFGRNISPEWLESELVQSVGAGQAVVFGDGEPNPRALLVIRDGLDPEQILVSLEKLNQRLPDYARLSTAYIHRRPLTLADGYLTANGRIVRDRVEADLSELLADSCPLFMHDSGAATPAPDPT